MQDKQAVFDRDALIEAVVTVVVPELPIGLGLGHVKGIYELFFAPSIFLLSMLAFQVFELTA